MHGIRITKYVLSPPYRPFYGSFRLIPETFRANFHIFCVAKTNRLLLFVVENLINLSNLAFSITLVTFSIKFSVVNDSSKTRSATPAFIDLCRFYERKTIGVNEQLSNLVNPSQFSLCADRQKMGFLKNYQKLEPKNQNLLTNLAFTYQPSVLPTM